MYMRRPHRVAIQQLQQHARGAVRGQRVRRRLQAVEVIGAVRIRAELAPEVVVGLVLRVLEIVLAVGGCLPDVDDGVGDALPGNDVGHAAVHERGLAERRHAVLDDAPAELAEGRLGGPEGPEDGRGGGVDVGPLVGDLVDEAGCRVSYEEA